MRSLHNKSTILFKIKVFCNIHKWWKDACNSNDGTKATRIEK